MINYLKEWCIKPVDKQAPRQPDDDLEGAEFTSTVQHIHNVYNYLYQNCPQGSLKELFHHSPAVFVELGRYGTHLHLHVISSWYRKQVTTSFDPAPADETTTGVQGASTTWRRFAGATQQACFSATDNLLMQQAERSRSPKSSLSSTVHWKAWEPSSSTYASFTVVITKPFLRKTQTDLSSALPGIC